MYRIHAESAKYMRLAYNKRKTLIAFQVARETYEIIPRSRQNSHFCGRRDNATVTDGN